MKEFEFFIRRKDAWLEILIFNFLDEQNKFYNDSL